MPPPTTPSAGSPITRITYDVLREIFTHCLPQYPLLQRQPNTKTAPMLLCHICSSWRAVALASAPLWAHLTYCFTTTHSPKHAKDPAAGRVRNTFMDRDFAFLRWWRENQGPIAPFLNLDVCQGPLAAATWKINGDSINFLLEYIFSAQYLELDIFSWVILHRILRSGRPVVFPNLRTLHVSAPKPHNDAFYRVARRFPPDALPALRHLAIIQLTPPDDFSTPTHWAALTHISLSTTISLDFWRAFIRAVPRLQWGDFDITTTAPRVNDTHPAPPPPECTLPALATLSITIRTQPESGAMFPFSVLFTGLHLPCVRTLSLAAPGMKKARTDSGGLHELYAVLASTPAVTTLALEDNLLSLFATAPEGPRPALRDAPLPIWQHAPALVRLQLAPPTRLFGGEAEEDALLEMFVRALFSDDCAWLDLRNDACPVRTIVVRSERAANEWLRESTIARMEESARGVPKVGLEFTSMSAARVAEGMRISWGGRG